MEVKIITSLSVEKQLDYLSSRLNEPHKNAPVLIVPEQFLFETERSMYTLLGARKIAATEITGFSKLAADVIKRYGIPKLYADDIVKGVTMYKVLSRLKTAFTYYNKTGKISYDFAQRMLNTVADFKAALITPEILRKSLRESQNGSLFTDSSGELTRKLADLTEIYDSYCNTLNTDFADKLDDNATASDLIGLHDCFSGKDVFLYGFDSFSNGQIGLIKALAASADLESSVEIFLQTDSKISESENLCSVNRLIERIERSVSRVAVLETIKLGGEPFSPEINLWTADNVSDECEFVAAEIRRLVTCEGYSCNEIAVLMPKNNSGSEGFVQRLKESMREYELKCYTDLPELIITKPMTRFIISALEAVNLATPKLLSYIRSGFVRVHRNLENYELPKELKLGKLAQNITVNCQLSTVNCTSRLSKRSMDLLERAANQYALTYREWGKPFPESNQDLSRIENLRKEIVAPLVELRKKCSNTTGGKITEALCEFLLETMQLQRTVLGICRGEKFLTEEFRQLWDLIIDVFESLHASLEDEEISLSDYTGLLCGVFSSVNIAKPPQVLDAVSIGDLERSRFFSPYSFEGKQISGIRVAFIVGANLGVFPKSVALGEKSGFSSREIEDLNENGLEVSANLEQRYHYERFLVNKALVLPSEKLYITAPLSNTAWEELLPSPLMSDLSAKHSVGINKTSDLPLSFRARTVKSARRIFAEENVDVLRQVLEILGNNPIKMNTTDVEHSLTPATAEKLLIPDRTPDSLAGFLTDSLPTFSPTAIETMMSCRYKFFCEYGLKLDIPVAENEEEPIAMERGNIIHYCLDKAMREIHALDDSDLDSFVENCIREYRNSKLPYGYAQTKRQEYILMGFKTGIVRMLKHFRRDFENSGFKPTDFEKKVDFQFGDVRLSGKIDRVDKLNEFIRVVDYKSGNKEMDFPSLFYGLDLQMLLYLYAVCSEGGKPSSALYMPSDGIKTDGVLVPEKGSLSADGISERKNWLSAHISSGIIVNDNSEAFLDFVAAESRYRSETGTRKAFLKTEKLTPASYDRLKEHCSKLINVQIKRFKRGNIDAVPVVQSKDSCLVCEYCDYNLSCGRKKVKIINKKAIKTMIGGDDGGE